MIWGRPNASGLCSGSTITGAGQDLRSLEFSEAAQNRDHELAVRGRGICPGIAERSEPGALVAYGRQRV
jgi:hypothetical protein